MKKFKYTLLSSVLATIILSCEKPIEQPNCSDETVKQTVIELSEEILIKEIATQNFIQYNFVTNPNSRLIIYADDVGKDAFMAELEEALEGEIKNTPTEKTIYSNSIKKAQDRFIELEPKLSNIRIESKEPELRKCTCKANLNLNNDKSLDLYYNVQINESEETFVELNIPEL